MTFGVNPANGEERVPRVTPETSLSEEQMKEALTASEKALSLGQQEFEVGLERLLGPAHPKIVRFKEIIEQAHKVHALRQKLFPLLVGPREEEKQKEITRLAKELRSLEEEMQRRVRLFDAGDARVDASQRADVEQKLFAAKAAAQMDAMRHELEATKQQLAERQMQLMETAKQMAKEERDRALPPLEDAELRIFHLKYITAARAAEAIETLFGADALRVAVDDRTNSLILLTKPESLKVMDALLMNLDREEAKDSDKKPPQPPDASPRPPRSLLLRLFWLADGLPQQGKDPAEVLPESVLRAIEKLGLVNPIFVTETVNALAVGDEEAVQFSINVPALLDKRSVGIASRGELSLFNESRVVVRMEVEVFGRTMESSELRGSLKMPLGHYMVLGTANSVISESTNPATAEEADKKTDAETQPEGEFAAGPARLMGAKPNIPKLSTPRFAFVIQVVEAESFSPEVEE
jgi:hypothetical protein